jgi:hypothetical protein
LRSFGVPSAKALRLSQTAFPQLPRQSLRSAVIERLSSADGVPILG